MNDRKVPGPDRKRPNAGQVIGEILLTVGVVIALFIFYEAVWTNVVSGRLQDELGRQLEQAWSTDPGSAGDASPADPPAPTLGEGFARLHIPVLDADFAVVEGTRSEDLRAGPGHYPTTQMPGEPGNFALAGHRIGSGGVFQHLDSLKECDAVVVETRTEWLTYRLLPLETTAPDRRAVAGRCLNPEQVDRVADGDYAHVLGRRITVPEDVYVINPMPGVSWIEPIPEMESIVTLTTCHPLLSNAERMIVHAVLVDTIPKTAGRLPAALQE